MCTCRYECVHVCVGLGCFASLLLLWLSSVSLGFIFGSRLVLWGGHVGDCSPRGLSLRGGSLFSSSLASLTILDFSWLSVLMITVPLQPQLWQPWSGSGFSKNPFPLWLSICTMALAVLLYLVLLVLAGTPPITYEDLLYSFQRQKVYLVHVTWSLWVTCLSRD